MAEDDDLIFPIRDEREEKSKKNRFMDRFRKKEEEDDDEVDIKAPTTPELQPPKREKDLKLPKIVLPTLKKPEPEEKPSMKKDVFADKIVGNVSSLDDAKAELELLIKQKPLALKGTAAESSDKFKKAREILEQHKLEKLRKEEEEKEEDEVEITQAVKEKLEEPIHIPEMKPNLYEPEEEKQSFFSKLFHGDRQPKKTVFREPKIPAPSGPERVLDLELPEAPKIEEPVNISRPEIKPVPKPLPVFEPPKMAEPKKVVLEAPHEEAKPKKEKKKFSFFKKKEAEEGPEFRIDLRPRLIELPEFKDTKKINIRYPLIPPYAYAHIFWSEDVGELVYFVEQPELTKDERNLLAILRKGIEEMLTVSFTKLKPSSLIKYIEENVKSLLAELAIPISKETYLKLMYYVYRDFIGLNEIEPLLRDYYIEDIECNGTGYPIFIVHRKYENMRTNILYRDLEKLGDFVEKLAQKTGRYVSYANPLLDGALPDGSRVNATYTKDITTRGPTFTIRKFTKEPWTAIHLIGYGTIAPEMMAYLWMAIQYRFNVMVIGETASGKTTFLNTIVHFIPPKARIVSIEDTRELNLAHSNWLPSVSRAGFGMPNLAGGEKYGEVSLFDLLRETFRQNPDYVIVGEARGAEASVLFQGMASGHPCFSTFHAGSVETFIRRLETPPINLSSSLVEVLDIVCICAHVKTKEQNMRRIKAIEEIEKIDEDMSLSKINHKYVWLPAKDQFASSKRSVIFEKISRNTGMSMKQLESELAKRTKLLETMYSSHIFNFREVAKILNDYYEDPDKVLKKFGVL